MALIDITPVMTSNTTPSPYVVSASTFYTGQEPYKAFDGVKDSVKSGWVTVSGNATGWIKLDFGNSIKCNAISLTSRSKNGLDGSASQVGTTEAPKNFKIYGSNDDISYSLILSLENEVLWTPEETRLYNFNTSVTYRYYKLVISSNNGFASYLGIGEIEFWQDDEVIPVENNNTVSRRYTLPFGSKLRLDNLTSDLTYMLATEDDGDNEGTLRLVNHAGKFIVPKAGQKMDLLFDGTASSNGEYTLSNSTKKYKQLIFVTNHLTNPLFKQSNIIAVSDIASYTSTQQTHTMLCHVSTNISNNVIYISFSSENTFKIYSANNIFGITRVYGIY